MNLNECLKKYLDKKSSIKCFKEEILNYVYKQVSKDKYIEAGDFILEFMPKLDSIIDSYNNTLSGFNHFINKHIKWLMYSFSKEYVTKKEKYDAYQSHYLAECKSTYCLDTHINTCSITDKALKVLGIKDGLIVKASSKKRLEIFTLKNSRSLTSDQINILAPLFDKTPEWLYKTKELLDDLCQSRIENREYQTLRYNRLFIEITRAQKKLTIMDDGIEKDILFAKMLEKQEIKKRLYENMSKRNCGPKNEEIAKILGIPKGTVDSSLFYMKKALSELLDD
ncbi:MAG: hypothetical protein OCD02_01960 [Spirochaetaceae bacterium]